MYTSSSYQRHARALVAVVLALAAIAGCKRQEPAATTAAANESVVSDAAQQAAQQITAEYLRDQITRYSADEFEGRGPATPADVKSRDYLVEQLKQDIATVV